MNKETVNCDFFFFPVLYKLSATRSEWDQTSWVWWRSHHEEIHSAEDKLGPQASERTKGLRYYCLEFWLTWTRIFFFYLCQQSVCPSMGFRKSGMPQNCTFYRNTEITSNQQFSTHCNSRTAILLPIAKCPPWAWWLATLFIEMAQLLWAHQYGTHISCSSQRIQYIWDFTLNTVPAMFEFSSFLKGLSQQTQSSIRIKLAGRLLNYVFVFCFF